MDNKKIEKDESPLHQNSFAEVKDINRSDVSHIESVGFTVSDLDLAINFYTGILPFKKISETEFEGAEAEKLTGVSGAKLCSVRLLLGREVIELNEYLTPKGRSIPPDSRSHDHWFQHIAIVVSDITEAYRQLQFRGVRSVSNAPQTLPGYLKQAAGIKAFYFQDSDYHNLELIEFPPDKISRKWRERAKNQNNLFLGIDHTAIVVRDTQKSLEFYRDVLHMKIASESENYGDEQENLSSVCGARVRITSLQTPQMGIGVELLEYLAPTDGRLFPKDTRPNDLWYWLTSFAGSTINDTEQILSERNFAFISDGIIAAPEITSPDFSKALLIRDHDGHAVRIVE